MSLTGSTSFSLQIKIKFVRLGMMVTSRMRMFQRRRVSPNKPVMQTRRQNLRRNVPHQRKMMKVVYRSPRRPAQPRKYVIIDLAFPFSTLILSPSTEVG